MDFPHPVHRRAQLVRRNAPEADLYLTTLPWTRAPRVSPLSLWPGQRTENGGEAGIRTLGTASSTTAFEAAAFNHSATSPEKRSSIVPNDAGPLQWAGAPRNPHERFWQCPVVSRAATRTAHQSHYGKARDVTHRLRILGCREAPRERFYIGRTRKYRIPFGRIRAAQLPLLSYCGAAKRH